MSAAVSGDPLLHCPRTLPLGQGLPDFLRVAAEPSAVLPPPYTTLRVNAARFAAEGMGFLVRAFTMLPPGLR